MLKAFSYTERKRNIKINEKDLSNQEKKIALQYVIDHPSKESYRNCPICGMDHSKYIFERWDVEYFYCKVCGTIYVPIDDDTEKGYTSLSEMSVFRNSDEYQEQEEEYRGSSWDEIVTWLSYRSYRYLSRNKGLSIIDIGNKYRGFVDRIRESNLCDAYDLRESFLENDSKCIEKADVILYLNQIKHEVHPVDRLKKIREMMNDNGLLVLSSRLGSGFDIVHHLSDFF